MYISYSKQTLPQTLRAGFLIDAYQRPRYWATVWSSVFAAQLAENTRTGKLRAIEQLYQHGDALHGVGALDFALGSHDYETIAVILESWFISIRNKPLVTRSDELRWTNGLEFVNSILAWLPNNDGHNDGQKRIEERLHRFKHLYRQLHIKKPSQGEAIRSLPDSVAEKLYEILDPESSLNPFFEPEKRWREYTAFILMLHNGLRRGELLLLKRDCIKFAWDKRNNNNRYWINVLRMDDDEEDLDPRYSKPSIKTGSSIRQIPISEAVAKIIQKYVENYRGNPEHQFLLSSKLNKPLSAESIKYAYRVITKAMPASTIKELHDRTGNKSVSPHDLRHTCAVIRLNQLLKSGDSMDEALQKMRTFFGWSKNSAMPSRYARAVFEDRLSGVWNSAFDERVELIRSIP